jgi:outer membrane translocation and assembly module TamA
MTAEYRWRPSRSVDMALFVDAGQVAAERRQLRLKEFDTAWGIGMRLHGPTFTALRIEGARSSQGWVLIFAGGPPF